MVVAGPHRPWRRWFFCSCLLICGQLPVWAGVLAPGALGAAHGSAEDGAVGVVEGPGDGVDGRAGCEAGEFGVDVRGGRQGAVAQVVEGDAGDAGFVAEQVEVVEDVLGVERAAVAVEDVAAVVGDVAEGAVELVVVDGGERRAGEEDAVREVDIVPAQGECLALADTGADHELCEVGVEGVGDVGEAQEAGGLLLGPQAPGGGGGAGKERGFGGVSGQAAV